MILRSGFASMRVGLGIAALESQISWVEVEGFLKLALCTTLGVNLSVVVTLECCCICPSQILGSSLQGLWGPGL